MSDDPYAALGVSKTASADDIRKAYKRIARESHPDLNPGDAKAEAKFKAASAAYDLLKDAEQRRRFDAGEIDASGQERPDRRFYREYAEGPEATYRSSRGFEDIDMSDVFSDLFGRRAGGGRAGGRAEGFSMRGQDQHFTLEISFLDAIYGATKRVTLPGGGPLEVAIPQGVQDGQTVRLRGKGAPGLGDGPPGDALVTVTVAPHPTFTRDGDDIEIELPITIDEAILGGKVPTPTIDGKVNLTIPKGASSGQTLRLRGRGVKRGDRRGDQRVRLRIVAPPEIDPGLQAFMETWRKDHAYDPRKGMS
ncbi:DnaJ C-terminal domain-containing protein [Amaricoccus sp.]|uniref:DnaJ C-terminal domain-containing protein n=1 Tax=Amaricoccus sp. TaxID=1872485 RepID=UPI001B59668B|nr:DnaJ C-terminal domain-containing protein [Amaricoccus sp.]MBP7001930.1 DnaJ domain-containing protein [Amaricoccus sp.]